MHCAPWDQRTIHSVMARAIGTANDAVGTATQKAMAQFLSHSCTSIELKPSRMKVIANAMTHDMNTHMRRMKRNCPRRGMVLGSLG